MTDRARHPERRPGAGQVGRVRMYIKADLGWLSGYPVGPPSGGALPWRTTTEARQAPECLVVVDGAALHRATRTWSKCTRQYRRALSRAVDDAPRWAARVRALIERLKVSVHGGQPPPSNTLDAGLDDAWDRSSHRATAAAIVRRWPALAPAVDALSWSCFCAPGRFGPALEALDAVAPALVPTLDVVETPLVWALRAAWLVEQHGLDAVRPAIRAVAGLRAHAVPSIDLGVRAREVAGVLRSVGGDRSAAAPPPPATNAPAELLAWSRALVERPRAERGRALAVFGAALPPAFPEPWADAWRTYAAVEATLAGLLRAHDRAAPAVRARGEAEADALEKLAESALPRFELDRLLAMVDYAAAPERAAWHEATLEAVSAIPADDRPLARVSRLAGWAALGELPAPRVRRWLRSVARWMRAAPPGTDVLWPWEVDDRRIPPPEVLPSETDLDVLESAPPVSSDAVCESMVALAKAWPDADELDPELLVALLGAGADPEGAVARVAALRRAPGGDQWWAHETVLIAHRIAGETGPFAEIIAALHRAQRGEHDAAERLAELDGPVPRPALAHLVATGALRRLLDLAERARAVRAAGRTVPAWPAADPGPPGERPWGYPPELAQGLRTLAMWHPTPRGAAGRVLAADFPDAEEIERRVANLDGLIATAGPERAATLSRQKERLRAWGGRRPEVSSKRLGRLGDKLFHAASVAGLDVWSRALEAELDALVTERIGGAPTWIRQRSMERALPALLALKPPFDALGLDVLRARTGPPPWDLRDAPPNRAFIERLTAQGLDLAPWLDDVASPADDDRSRLSLEPDPLELMEMGGHFRTCLSPGECNFFSVVANIVDVNKRVLYARDREGRVVGRRLLALTVDGGLLLFHPYHHEAAGDFPERSESFAEALAARMKTLLVAAGTVELLVVPEWYDDGARSPAGVAAAFTDGSALRSALQTVRPGRLVETLKHALDPLPLNDLTLSQLLGLPEIAARPELAQPLVPHIEALPRGQAWIAALEPLQATGDATAAVRFLRAHAARALRGGHDGWLNPAIMEPLVALDPSLALRIVGRRASRQPLDDAFGPAYWRGRALESLRRPRRALAAYRQADEGHGICNCSLHQDARARMGRLAAGER